MVRQVGGTEGLRNTRRSMGDGTLSGRTRIATPFRPDRRRRPAATIIPHGTSGGIPATVTLVASDVEVPAAGGLIEFDDLVDTPARHNLFPIDLPSAEAPLPYEGTWEVSVHLRWLLTSTFRGGGSIELLLDGLTVWPVEDESTEAAPSAAFDLPEFMDSVTLVAGVGSELSVRVVPGSGQTQTAVEVSVEVALREPRGMLGSRTPARPTYPVLAAYGDGRLLGSTDGIGWTDLGQIMPWSGSTQTRDLRYIQELGMWIASSNENRMGWSTNGGNWHPVDLPEGTIGSGQFANRIGWNGNTLVVGVGSTTTGNRPDKVLRSTDGITWQVIEPELTIDGSVRQGRFFSAMWIPSVERWLLAMSWASGSAGRAQVAWSDDDGLTWQTQASHFTNQSGRIELDPVSGEVIYFGTNNALFRSADNGESWSSTNGPDDPAAPTSQLRWIDRLGLFVAPYADGRILTSPGSPPTWTDRSTPVDELLIQVKEAADGLLIVGGEAPSEGSGRILTSPDAQTWTLRADGLADGDITAIGGDGSV